MATVTFVEETASGVRGEGRVVEFAVERVTVEELIRRRVFLGTAERPQEQAEAALRAFAGNGLLVLVGDRQVTELDEEVELSAGSEVRWERNHADRLSPLRGRPYARSHPQQGDAARQGHGDPGPDDRQSAVKRLWRPTMTRRCDSAHTRESVGTRPK